MSYWTIASDNYSTHPSINGGFASLKVSCFRSTFLRSLRDSSLFRWPLKLVQQSKQMLFPSENKAFFQRYLPACQGEERCLTTLILTIMRAFCHHCNADKIKANWTPEQGIHILVGKR